MKMRVVLAGLLTLTVAGLLYAQTSKAAPKTAAKSAAPKAAAKPNPNMPTPVQGEPVTTKSGLKYWDIKVGTGATAQRGANVNVKYAGWLTNGKKFDSGNYPFKVGNGDVIRGWDEGVEGMKVGGKRQLRIPPDLAYGNRGAADVIPPGATLIFDVELLGVQP